MKPNTAQFIFQTKVLLPQALLFKDQHKRLLPRARQDPVSLIDSKRGVRATGTEGTGNLEFSFSIKHLL